MARGYTIESKLVGANSGIDYTGELNEQQYAAVTCAPGPALVIAGAGSGKTRTLTYRVAYLLDNGVAPENILLLTFTNKAAKEMTERVQSIISKDLASLWSGTFHSIGNRILRRHPERINRTSGFSILDRDDQKGLLSQCIEECKIDAKALRFPKPKVLGDMFSLAESVGCELGEIIDSRFHYFGHLSEAIADVRTRYDEKKVETNNLDFDDLISLPLKLLSENSEVGELYQYQFQFILVDEYQDTNRGQSDLVDFLAEKHNNLMVVGDDAQSIYSWRGADFANILEFKTRYPDAQTFKIEANYRSVPEILSLANAVILQNQRQFKKNLRPFRANSDHLPAIVPLNDPNVQAQFLAQRIEELQDEGVEAKNIAILYRAHYQSMELQMELTRRGIPFSITSGLRFFEQAHIKDVAAFMKFAVNRRDEVAFKRMACLLDGVGERGADKLWREWLACPGASSDSIASFSEFMLEFKVGAKGKEAWEQLVYTLDELVVRGETAPVGEMSRSILEGVYEDYMMRKYPNFESRLQDIEQVVSFGEQFQNVEDLLAQLALLTNVDGSVRSSGGDERDADKVCLSTVHQAKGLEWPVVFVIWLAEGMFPNARAIEDEDGFEDLDGIEEERRLFYVATTRAMDELYLVYPKFWPNSRSGNLVQTPSRFISELSEELFEEWEIGVSH